MSSVLRPRGLAAVAAVALSLAATAARALSLSPTLLPVSGGELKLGEWNSNFAGARAIADGFNIPLVVFYGGLSCGKCEELQYACLSDEFLSWQAGHKMLMVFTTNNSNGNASTFAKPEDSTGYPFVAVYWNRDGVAPEKGSALYAAFNGRDGEMPVKGGSLASQLIGSIESVAGSYDFSSAPDISSKAELIYSEPVTTRISYDVGLFTGLDASAALAPQTVYNLKGTSKPKLKKVAGRLPSGVKLVYSNGAVALSGSAKKSGLFSYTFSIQQNRSGVLHAGPDITISFDVVAANDGSRGGCAMLGRALKATVPLYSADPAQGAAGTLELSATARGKVTAKYTGLSRAKASFSGTWTSIDSGVASASLVTRKGAGLVLELAGDGRLKAVLSDPSLPSALESPDGLVVCTGLDASAFSGEHVASLGGGTLGVSKVSAAGKARWKGRLEGGKNVSGNANAMLDSNGNCIVHVFKVSSKFAVSEVLRIRPGEAAAEIVEGGSL